MNNEAFMPIGDILRQFIAHNMIKGSDLKALLQARGVFSSSNDKKILGPIIIKSGLTPYEFESLKDLVKEKEDSPKLQTKQLKWNQDTNQTLLTVLGTGFSFDNLITDVFNNLTIENTPSFTAAGNGDNPNHIMTEVKLKRRDRTKNFGEDESYFDCAVELQVNPDNQIELNIQTKHTAKETLAITNEIVKRASVALKQANAVVSDEVKRILFTDFVNESRIDYLTQLTQSVDKEVYRKDTKGIHIKPDENVLGEKPKELEVLEKKIKDLKLKGQNLDSSVFLRLKELKKHIRLYSLTCTYEIQTDNVNGTCDIEFEFPELDQMNASELTISMGRFSTKEKLSTRAKTRLKIDVLRAFEAKKLKLLPKHSFKHDTAEPSQIPVSAQ